ncbi:Fe-S cluster assembly protein NifU, putative [Entamoeba histolytica HM-1:IMSS-B]|uniref:Nitrogen fixation protein NifU n=7 Tax=Entamoeba histolytica TaxID=5759 RepID=A0A8U0WQ51_ENTH1|nr:Fe-S cluster assembly protein NifU, putative [Entamoeba histolytica HM-1:IMSS]AAK85709.1 iron-sulfur cluster NifU-like protein [Entamoeba histolytica]EMD48393.1 ironsulfur cluster NifU family protein [Entamoeba histolytica KU27]EMH73812.1 Fe-S cluster assembly protein NifU, putative [Entamoeba histolytica HM-1:IMSS-B]EMS13644.1 iron-sulfur cluster NifU family protein [Entamoeba histolytica HM-3:IMSS]ENY65254.1 iron-sulfur cluster NifU family protein, putative [Entamoeba histolytica HM-1:IMS|eukprot:XP_655888.1 Fe-S cluster assembly protein NifU, putative [Entamoeba histolytica HM-1:IMSS]
MSKNKLIGGALWEHYSKKVKDHMDNPQHRGEITEEEGKEHGWKVIVADWGAEACGDAVRMYWGVNPKTNIVEKATFKSFGCGTAIASSDVTAELCIGKTVDECLKITNLDVERAMRDSPDVPAVPPQKMHCSVMSYDVVKKAASLYKGVNVEDLDDEEIVCSCARVSLRLIKDTIRLNDLKTVEDITHYTKAGAFCGSCVRPGGHEEKKYYLEDILRQTRAEMEIEKMKVNCNSNDFEKLTMVKKISKLNQVFEQYIDPIVKKDGGSVEVYEVKDGVNGEIIVYIQYSGKCVGCAAANGATKEKIQTILRDTLSKKIIVIPVDLPHTHDDDLIEQLENETTLNIKKKD